MRYIAIALIFLLSTSIHAAEFIPKKLSQMTDDLGVGTHTADTSDPHGTTTTQTNLTVGSLTVNGSITLGTVTLSGYIKDNGGSATSTRLTSVQINSGTATLSGIASPYIAQTTGTGSDITLSGTNIINGVAAPYIAQTNGTGSGNSLTNLKVLTALMVGTTTSDALCEIYGGNIDFERTDSAPLFNFYRNSAVPAAENSLGVIYFYGNNETPIIKEYAAINGVITDKTASSEDGRIGFWAMVAGSTAERMRLEGANLGIGTTTPQTRLAVNGDISIQSSGYLNFGVGSSSSGYGIRDNSGTMQSKNSAGTWTDIPTATTGGGWTDNGTTITENTVTDTVILGSTTSSGRQLTCVGSSTFYGQIAMGSNTTVVGGLNNTLLDLIIGDSDTGLKWVQDGDLAIYGNGDEQIKIDGNNDKVLIGTTTASTRLNVGGTITASGFSGNGAALTGVVVDFGIQNSKLSLSTQTSNLLSVGTQSTGNLEASRVVNLPWTESGTNTIQGTVTNRVLIGTTTVANNSVLTISGSGSSALSVLGNPNLGNLGTGTTNTMTGTTTSGHTVTPSSQNGAYAGYLAFDKVLNEPQRWIAQTQVATLTYDFGTGTTKVIGRYDLAVENSSSDAPTAFEFAGSNDNINYVGINYKTGYTWDNPSNPDRTFNTFTIATSTTAYQFYRLKILTMQSGNNATIEEMRLIQDNLSGGLALYVNGSSTVLIGTTTANSTSTAYLFQIAGSGLATSWGVTCYESIKSIIGSGSDVINEGYNAVMGTKLFKHHPKITTIDIKEAEAITKAEYVNGFVAVDFETFKNDRLGSYTTLIAGSVTVNWTQFKKDFQEQYVNPRYDEFYVLPDMNKRINDKKVDLESDKSIINITPISDNASTSKLFKRGDNRILELQPQIGCLQATAQYQDAQNKAQDVEIKKLIALVGSLTVKLQNAGIQ